MIFQGLRWTCGPAALVNALIAAGRYGVTEERAVNACKTTRDGTDEDDIKQGLEFLETDYEEFSSNSAENSWNWLRGCLMGGNPVLLAVDDDEHWVTAVGVIGNGIVIIDPDGYERYIREQNGVFIYYKTDMLNRWCNNSPYDGQEMCYGIEVKHK